MDRRSFLTGLGLTPAALSKLSHAELIQIGQAVVELEGREAKAAQSKRGWYDKDGVRQGGLIAFVRYFWEVLEPSNPFVDGWPLWAMCEHLEAVTYGEITRLLINVPPGFMKSMLVDIFWPAWEWGPVGKPHYRYIAFSYSAHLTERDNDKFRLLVASEKYQKLYGPVKYERVVIDELSEEPGVGLRNKTIVKVQNNKTGWKLASSVGGVATGERGDRVIIDDPHNVTEAESEVVRSDTVRWFRESVSSRFNNLDTGALVIIMQRVHEADVAGNILDDEHHDYTHLMIPWFLEPERVVRNGEPILNDIGWYDPRLDEDENDSLPAWPERFSKKAIERTRREVTEYGWAAQYQQSPVPRGGGLIKRTWWQVWEDNKYPLFDFVVGSIDGSFSTKEFTDPSAMTVWGTFTHPKTQQRGVMLIDAWRKWLNMHGESEERRENEIAVLGDTMAERIRKDLLYKHRTSDSWGLVEWAAFMCRYRQVDVLLIESKASGIPAAQELMRLHGREGWGIQLVNPKGDKEARVLAVQPMFSQGLIWAPSRDWAEMTIGEVTTFPYGRYDDLTDTTSQALRWLRDNGKILHHAEEHEAKLAAVRHRGKPKPLYPV